MPPETGSFAAEAAVSTNAVPMLGRYRLLDRLGEGGMAELFLAEVSGVEGFSRTFVLKRLRPALAGEKDAIAQFVDEARLQASLVHSNIVPVFDFGMVGSQYFMTQEYIVGRDLARLMARHQERGRAGIAPEHRLSSSPARSCRRSPTRTIRVTRPARRWKSSTGTCRRET